jgi:hypothetical protein
VTASSRFPLSGRDRALAPEGWHLDALCAQIDPEEWYFTNHDRAAHQGGLTEHEVVEVCQRCPAMRYCLQRALDGDGPRGVEEFGMWAATNFWHRRTFAAAISHGKTDIDALADQLRRQPAHQIARRFEPRHPGRSATIHEDAA